MPVVEVTVAAARLAILWTADAGAAGGGGTVAVDGATDAAVEETDCVVDFTAADATDATEWTVEVVEPAAEAAGTVDPLFETGGCAGAAALGGTDGTDGTEARTGAGAALVTWAVTVAERSAAAGAAPITASQTSGSPTSASATLRGTGGSCSWRLLDIHFPCLQWSPLPLLRYP
ncbi:MAG TPA: hypothetical protein VF032_04380 [Thermoleophilaceae bacterium]